MTILSFNRAGNEGELLGVWKLTYEQAGGSQRRRGRELWVFRPGKLSVIGENHEFNYRTSIDATKNPKHIDTDNLFRAQGIYELEGNDLRIIFGVRTVPRPTAFVIEPGDMQSLSVLQRLDVSSRQSLRELRSRLAAEIPPLQQYPAPLDFDRQAADDVDALLHRLPERSLEPADPNELPWRIFWLITEVDNGGMHQYLGNSSGEFAAETVEDLEKIGAPETAAMIKNACGLFSGRKPPSDFEERRAQLEAFSLEQMDALHDLSQRFYSRREDLNVLLRDYWETTHPA